MAWLTDLLPLLYGLAAGGLGALLTGRLQRRLAYQRGMRHGQLLTLPPIPDRYAAGFLAGVRSAFEYERTRPTLLEQRLADIRARQAA